MLRFEPQQATDRHVLGMNNEWLSRDSVNASVQIPVKVIEINFCFLMTCLADAIEKDNFTSAKRMIKELGGWPVMSADWKEDTFSLIELLRKIRLYTNSPPLMDMYVYDDSKNPTRNILYVRNSVYICFTIFMRALAWLFPAFFLKIKYIHANQRWLQIHITRIYFWK